jgi:hypothetical protein
MSQIKLTTFRLSLRPFADGLMAISNRLRKPPNAGDGKASCDHVARHGLKEAGIYGVPFSRTSFFSNLSFSTLFSITGYIKV